MDEEYPQWEYGVFKGNDWGHGTFQLATGGYSEPKDAMLPQLGNEGWEGYAMSSGASQDRIFMKRKKQHTSRDSGYGR